MGVVFFLSSAYREISIPYDLMGMEQITVFFTDHLVKGQPLYENFCNFPYLINPYPPVYFFITALIAKLCGIQSFFNLLVLSRLLTLAATLLAAFAIFKISRRLQCNNIVSGMASLIFLANPLLYRLGYVGRSDMIACLFSLLAIYSILKGRRGLYFYLSVIFALLAIYSRQQYISVFISIVIYLLCTHQRKQAIKFTAYYLSVGLAFFIWLNYITNGSAYLNLVIANIGSFDPSNSQVIWFFMLSLLPSNLILIVLAMFILKREYVLLKAYVLFSFIMVVVTSLKVGGGGPNYWLEVLAISAVMSGPIIERILFYRKRNLIYLMLFSILLFPYVRYSIAWLRGRFAAEDFYEREALVKFIRNIKGYVWYDLSLDVFILADKPVVNTAWTSYGLLVRRGRCDDSFLVSMLKDKKFGCIIFYIPPDRQRLKGPKYLTENMQRAIDNNYVLHKKAKEYWLFLPSD